MAILLALASMGGFIAYDALKGRKSNPEYLIQSARDHHVTIAFEENGTKFSELLNIYC